MKNVIRMFVVIIVFFMTSCSQEQKWEKVVKKAKQDFTLVLTKDIVEKTIDDFLVDQAKGYGVALENLNWNARANFLQAQTPWTDDQYWWAAYATFTAWDCKIPVNDYTNWYFQKAGVDKALAQPLLNLRTSMLSIAKEYLATPENLNDLYLIYKPMLVKKFRGREFFLRNAASSLDNYFGNKELLSDYELKFFERRKVEGGINLILEYQKILHDLITEIEAQ